MDGFASISLQPKGAALSVFLKRDLCMFWPRWVFFAARRLSLVAASEGCSSLQCTGFSCEAQALGVRALVAVVRWLSSCSTRLLCGTWDLPGPGIELVSLALLCGFSITGAPGKPLFDFLKAGRTGHSPLLPCQNAIPFFFFFFGFLSKALPSSDTKIPLQTEKMGSSQLQVLVREDEERQEGKYRKERKREYAWS